MPSSSISNHSGGGAASDQPDLTALDPSTQKLQKLLDQACFMGAGGQRHKRLGNFLNGTWLGERLLHVVLTDLPVGGVDCRDGV